MKGINNPALKLLALSYFELKRWFFQLRHPNVKLGKGVRIKGTFIVKGKVRVEIGPDSRLGKKVSITGSGNVKIGRNVSVNGTWICCETSITINEDCLISDCFIQDTDFHNLAPDLRHCPPGPKVSAPITLERNVWVGARSTVMKGVTIGENSVIGLGSIVRKSVPANVVVIGNPQQIVKHFNVSPIDLAEREHAIVS